MALGEVFMIVLSGALLLPIFAIFAFLLFQATNGRESIRRKKVRRISLKRGPLPAMKDQTMVRRG